MSCTVKYTGISAWELPFEGALKKIALRPNKELPKKYVRAYKQLFGDHNHQLVKDFNFKRQKEQIKALKQLLNNNDTQFEKIKFAMFTIYLVKTKPPKGLPHQIFTKLEKVINIMENELLFFLTIEGTNVLLRWEPQVNQLSI